MQELSEEQRKILEEMESDLGPEYVAFSAGETVRMTFTGWPAKGQFATETGVIVPSYYFPVEVDGEDMILSASSRRLQRLLFPLLRAGDLIDGTYEITAIGEGMKRKWSVKGVA